MTSSIKGINGNNIDVNIQTSKNIAQEGEFDAMLKQIQETKDEKKLMEACKNLESVFVNMMFKQMQNSIQKTKLIDGGMGEEMFQDMLTEKYSEEATKGQGMGLAQVMFKQLTKYNTNKSEG